MTPDQEMDRVERIARLLSKPDLRARAESRKQLQKLKLLLEAQKERRETGLCASPESAKQAEKLKLLMELGRKNEGAMAKRSESQKQQADPDTNESD